MIKFNGEILENFKGEYLQQAKRFCDKTKTNIYINYLDTVKDAWNEKGNNYCNRYKVIIKRNNKQMSVIFTDSIYNTENGIKPNIYDILACLTKDNPNDFEEFCFNYGYDEDSRGAYKTYLAVKKEYKNVERLFGDVIEELQEIY